MLRSPLNRIAGAMVTSRTVDLRLERQSDSNITFSALVKDEHPLIQEFLESKSVKVSNQVMDDMMGTSQAVVCFSLSSGWLQADMLTEWNKAAAMMDVDSDDGDDSDNSAAEERKQAAKGGAKGNINQMNMEDEDSEGDFSVPAAFEIGVDRR